MIRVVKYKCHGCRVTWTVGLDTHTVVLSDPRQCPVCASEGDLVAILGNCDAGDIEHFRAILARDVSMESEEAK